MSCGYMEEHCVSNMRAALNRRSVCASECGLTSSSLALCGNMVTGGS